MPTLRFGGNMNWRDQLVLDLADRGLSEYVEERSVDVVEWIERNVIEKMIEEIPDIQDLGFATINQKERLKQQLRASWLGNKNNNEQVR
jgi:hypothetical protein